MTWWQHSKLLRNGIFRSLLLLPGLLLLTLPLLGQQDAALTGSVRDRDSGQPVAFVQLFLQQAGRATQTDGDGVFSLLNLPAGSYTLHAFRIGYLEYHHQVELGEGEKLTLAIEMKQDAIMSEEIVVHESRTDLDELGTSTFSMSAEKLRENLGLTIAETLEKEPGISMRSMGPAPARPVLRGLGGERLLVLEDGERTGDLSGSSSDHALAIDPLMTDEIEIVRGPQALLYGPNAMGGVVNVVRNSVPNSMPDHAHVDFAFQPQSVNNGVSSGVALHTPLVSNLSAHVGASVKSAGDISTPEGRLGNTGLFSLSSSGGLGYSGPDGYLGISGGYYQTEYGIPGGFVGAHPGGVDIAMTRYHVDSRAEYRDLASWLPRVEARATYSWYHHEEFEGNGTLGIEYGLLSYNAALTAHTGRLGPFTDGAVGIWGEFRDYASGGFSFTPASTEWTVAGMMIQGMDFGLGTLRGGVRYDLKHVTPDDAFTATFIDDVRARTFGGVSASATASLLLTRRISVGVTGMRSIRMPGIEELYSGGPHLAAYSFEIGQPDLKLEEGLGMELFTRYDGERGTLTAALFRNSFSGFIYPQNTGELNYRVYLPIYQYAGEDARMWGGEIQGSATVTDKVAVDGSGSYVQGSFSKTDLAIPWIPPLQGRMGVRYRTGKLSLALFSRMAAPQERLGPFEERTDGYVTFGATAQYVVSTGRLLHTLNLAIENIANTAYRDHLSRVKSIMPEPGRNLRLLYRMYL